jgi:methylmalonyl-CoA mutase
MITEGLLLASDFEPASREDWRKMVDRVLKGAPFAKLRANTYNGLSIDPIYVRAKGILPVIGRPAAAPWEVTQRVDHPDPARANMQALEDLENGATGLEVDFRSTPGGRGFGLADAAPETLARAFADVHLDADIAVAFNPVFGRHDSCMNFADLVERRKVDPAKVNVRFNYQALSSIAIQGAAFSSWSDSAKSYVETVRQMTARGFKGPFALADGRPVHDAGGSEAQELAFALALGTTYLRMMEDGGFDLDFARKAVSFRLCADADQFLTMAKFRALRLLWARIEEACGLAPRPVFIAAETAWRMLTRRDPYVNMLRATVAAFSAGLGGANAVTVLPHTLALGLPDPLARRIARNTQLLLLEESNLAKVSDPAAGSGGIEALTEQLCDEAWLIFQEIETAGGAFAALEQDVIQGKVTATRQIRHTNIAKRTDKLTGTSEFPNLQESSVTVLEAKQNAVILAFERPSYTFEPLSPMRHAQPFESLRDQSDRLLASDGQRPKVFLANLGTPADFTARATFVKSFFEAGGIEANESAGFVDLTELAKAFENADVGLVCVCSSDKLYEHQAEEAARILRKAGARHIYLAGSPNGKEDSLRASGFCDFINAKSDVLACLQEAYRRLTRPRGGLSK